jgi:hypothetical protein
MIVIYYTHPPFTSDILDYAIGHLWPRVREDFSFYSIFVFLGPLILLEEHFFGICGLLYFFLVPREAHWQARYYVDEGFIHFDLQTSYYSFIFLTRKSFRG